MDVEKVIEELEEARKCGNDNTPFMNEILDNAIQTIRELKEENKWHLVADNDFPTNDDNRFYMCISENHEEDLPTMFQYDS